MVVFSSDPKEGYLTKQGIQQVKSAFARRIFRDDLLHVYEQKTEYRASTQREARLAMEELIQQMRNGDRDNPHLEQLTTALALRLQTTKGKKVYGRSIDPKFKPRIVYRGGKTRRRIDQSGCISVRRVRHDAAV